LESGWLIDVLTVTARINDGWFHRITLKNLATKA